MQLSCLQQMTLIIRLIEHREFRWNKFKNTVFKEYIFSSKQKKNVSNLNYLNRNIVKG